MNQQIQIPKDAWPRAYEQKLANDKLLTLKKRTKGGFEGGECPHCGQTSLWCGASLYELKCNHQNSCGYVERVSERYPEVKREVVAQYSQQVEGDRLAKAKSFLASRGFDPERLKGLFRQGATKVDPKDPNSDWSEVVIFELPGEFEGKRPAWARLINTQGPDKARFWGNYGGLCWHHPEADFEQAKRIWIVEGIFHALALHLVGEAAIASLSASNVPTQFIEAHVDSKAIWYLGQDHDKAGLAAAKKLKTYFSDLDLEAVVALPPKFKDWDDLYKSKVLTTDTKEEIFSQARLSGSLETATSPEEYAFYLYKKSRKPKTIFSFGPKTYCWRFKESSLECEGPSLNGIQKSDFGSELGQAISRVSNLFSIAFFGIKYLYTQEDRETSERSFFLEIYHQNKHRQHIQLEAAQVTTSPAFTSAILSKAGVYFEGEQDSLKMLLAEWFRYPKDPIQTVPWAGYLEDKGVYVFPQVAYDKQGKTHHPNSYEFFTLEGLRIKSSHSDPDYPLSYSTQLDLGWLPDFLDSYANRGLFGLCFFIGSLFCMQYRAKTGAFPILALIGLPGTGKTQLLKFLWRLFGRPGFEGAGLTDVSSPKGLFRQLEKFSGLPTVFSESDETDVKKSKGLLNPENFKPLYNGGQTRIIAKKTMGSETHSPKFRSTVVFSQNGEVEGSQALQERILRLYFDKKQHTEEGFKAAERIKDLEGDLSGFRHLILSHHPQFFEDMITGLARSRNWLKSAAQAKKTPLLNERIVFNYASILAVFWALKKLLPVFESSSQSFSSFVLELAIERQTATAQDKPLIQTFFDSLLDVMAQNIIFTKATPTKQRHKVFKLNHAQPGEQTELLKINITQVVDEFKRRGLYLPDLHQLKKDLHGSTRFKFVEGSKITWSWAEKSIRCWTFAVPTSEQRNFERQLEESVVDVEPEPDDGISY